MGNAPAVTLARPGRFFIAVGEGDMSDPMGDALKHLDRAAQLANQAMLCASPGTAREYVRQAAASLAAAEALLSECADDAGWVPMTGETHIPAWLDIEARFADGSVQACRAGDVALTSVVAYRVQAEGVAQ